METRRAFSPPAKPNASDSTFSDRLDGATWRNALSASEAGNGASRKERNKTPTKATASRHMKANPTHFVVFQRIFSNRTIPQT